ncbi:MAG TPA: nitrate/sulfonate/bicarbonate ABC transporter ATP-binding protein [Bacillota bacterium]|nr:nitrate/sulfonate/bicarbonate ABC transporter ATP-binding protein [Bacillota bacterium]
MAEPVLIAAHDIVKRFESQSVIDHITLELREDEFVALLGPSGSGKSTLLRIITGLLQPNQGEILYRGQRIEGPNPHAAMVFQTFALYPWLTVAENVELGLKASGVPLQQRRDRAEKLIGVIGLDGYEDAYPKELSGGMRQRVGFARALAVEPELLCMDEPFSALDFLTAENLRSELLDLWLEKRTSTRAILMVTHGIEEAVFMADRIVVLGAHPARVLADIRVPLPQPRNRKRADFLAFVDRVYKIVTEGADARTAAARAASTAAPQRARPRQLPPASIGMMTGLLELLTDRGGRDDLYHLGSELMLEVDDLLPVTEAIELLQLGEVVEGDIVLTPLGKTYAEAETSERKRIFAEQVADQAPFSVIRRVLESKKNQTMPKEFFLDVLQQQFSEEDAEQQLQIAIAWGRYAEMFAYDPASEEFYIEEEPAEEPATIPPEG